MPSDNLKDWSKFKHLTKQTQSNLAPTDSFNKSKTIEHLYKTQEQVIKRAQQSGDSSKVRDAQRFAKALEGEVRFIRNSK